MTKKTTTTNPAKNNSKKSSETTSPAMDRGNDSYVLKLSGKAESPQPMKIGHNVHVTIEGSIISEMRSDNEDGTFTTMYNFKAVRIELLQEKGEMIKLKDTRSNSQLIRSLLYKRWVNAASSIDFDEFYDKVSKTIMFHLNEIVDWMESENK